MRSASTVCDTREKAVTKPTRRGAVALPKDTYSTLFGQGNQNDEQKNAAARCTDQVHHVRPVSDITFNKTLFQSRSIWDFA